MSAPEVGKRRTASDEQASLDARLRRLEGQARGITEMVVAGRDTLETLQQFSALIAATRQAATAFALIRARQTLSQQIDDPEAIAQVLDALEQVIGRASRLP